MEASASSSPFDAGMQGPTDDPFAGAEAEFEQDNDPLLGEPDPPLVNREGERIDQAAGVAPSAEDEEALAEADRLREEGEAAMGREAEPEPAEQPQLAAEGVPDPAPATGATHGEPGPPADPTAASGEASPASEAIPASDPATPSSPAARDAAAPAASPGDGGPSPASATAAEGEKKEDPSPAASTSSEEPGAAAGAEEAAVPDEKKDKKGVVTHRRYIIMRPLGEGRWEEVAWHEKDGKIVKKGTAGASRQKVCLARGQEEALGIGWAAMGRPPGGVKLVAIAMTYWQPRHVEPEEVPLTKQRLNIR